MNGPLICNACGKVYLGGDDDGVCDDPACHGAALDPLLGFVSYRRQCLTHRGGEINDLALRIKDRVEKVLHARRIPGGFFIDKTGIAREDFEKKIRKTIQVCKGRVFLLILTPGALDCRDDEENDWLQTEIRLAIKHGLEIVVVIASKYRQDQEFVWPETLPAEIAEIQKKNATLRFIGDLDEAYLVDATQHIATEVARAMESFSLPESSIAGNGARTKDSSPKRASASRREPRTRSIGLDIGGSNIRARVVEFSSSGTLEIVDRRIVADVRRPVSARSVMDQIKSVISDIHSTEVSASVPLSGIGIAAAGQVDLRSGVLKFSPALAIRNLSIKSMLASAFPGAEVRVDNDVRCATRCELYLGAGRDFDNFICIFVGTGVGSGIAVDNKILFGTNYCAGEIGHTKIASDGPICSCGQTGCLEAFINAGAICDRARAKATEWKNRGLDTVLSDQIGENTPRSVAVALESGDLAAQEVADEIGQKLGVGIANYLNIINPAAVVLGGGIMSGFFMSMSDGIARGVRSNALSDVANTPIVHSQYSDDGAALGAALLFHPDSHWPF